MSERTVTIRPITLGDEPAWRRLWAGYLEFYEASLPPETTEAAWARIVGVDPAFGCVVAEVDGAVCGIANYVLHGITWTERPACLLHDLFVSPEARGLGAGRKLIEHLIAKAESDGWARVYWVTQESNSTARALYDRITPADGFVRYTVKVQH